MELKYIKGKGFCLFSSKDNYNRRLKRDEDGCYNTGKILKGFDLEYKKVDLQGFKRKEFKLVGTKVLIIRDLIISSDKTKREFSFSGFDIDNVLIKGKTRVEFDKCNIGKFMLQDKSAVTFKNCNVKVLNDFSKEGLRELSDTVVERYAINPEREFFLYGDSRVYELIDSSLALRNAIGKTDTLFDICTKFLYDNDKNKLFEFIRQPSIIPAKGKTRTCEKCTREIHVSLTKPHLAGFDEGAQFQYLFVRYMCSDEEECANISSQKLSKQFEKLDEGKAYWKKMLTAFNKKSSKLRVAELKQACYKLGMSGAGRKSELIESLASFMISHMESKPYELCTSSRLRNKIVDIEDLVNGTKLLFKDF